MSPNNGNLSLANFHSRSASAIAHVAVMCF